MLFELLFERTPVPNLLHRPGPVDAPAPARPKNVAAAGTLLAAAVIASLVNVVIAAIGHAAGASHQFMPLNVPSFVSFTVLGILIGAAGWAIVRRRATRPRALLRRLVPIVLGISFIPDLAMLFSSYLPHSNAAGVVSLLAMHVVVAAVAVTAYTRALPVD